MSLFPFGGVEDTETLPAPGGIIAAPSGPLFFDGGSVWAHRFTIAVPIR